MAMALTGHTAAQEEAFDVSVVAGGAFLGERRGLWKWAGVGQAGRAGREHSMGTTGQRLGLGSWRQGKGLAAGPRTRPVPGRCTCSGRARRWSW